MTISFVCRRPFSFHSIFVVVVAFFRSWHFTQMKNSFDWWLVASVCVCVFRDAVVVVSWNLFYFTMANETVSSSRSHQSTNARDLDSSDKRQMHDQQKHENKNSRVLNEERGDEQSDKKKYIATEKPIEENRSTSEWKMKRLYFFLSCKVQSANANREKKESVELVQKFQFK